MLKNTIISHVDKDHTMIQNILSGNWGLFVRINSAAGQNHVLDKFMIFCAQDLLFLLPIILLVSWCALARWSPLLISLSRRNLRPFDRVDRRVGQQFLILACLAVLIAVGINILVGSYLYEPRPFVSHPDVVHQLIPHPADASFPSDHEAVAGSIAAVMFFYAAFLLRRIPIGKGNIVLSQRIRTLLAIVPTAIALCIIALIGISRVYVGVHYPLDILGGIICGVVGGLIVLILRILITPALDAIICFAETIHLA